ncbi:hypothetical protein FEF34_37970 [Streptomyces marianii]|uniref:Uncharacterized protein n=1 Tax=Streptomyces marianii TaxID=1817406 RepID=A0A5R9DWF6_9ACTN|nr:hypothetical protein FEF34_37970 [Streptomyces marianii]
MFADLVDGHLLFALRVSHPSIIVSIDRSGPGPRVDLRDAVGHAAHAELADGGLVSVSGDRPGLRGALRSGHQLWRARGRPDQWDFGITVTRLGQTVWADGKDRGPYTR